MTADKDSVQLSDYCFAACEALTSITAQDGRTGGFNESLRIECEDLERCVC
jgi:hypothetical protein